MVTGRETIHRVYIGLGSNLEQPQLQIKQAMDELASIKQSHLAYCSSLYKSKPMGPQDQADFINAVVELHTALNAVELLSELQSIEHHHHRHRDGQRWGPRTLDLDILLYDDTIVNQPDLIIPHPGMHERDFVLYPLYDINPDIEIPGRGHIKTLIQQCPDYGVEKIQ